MDIAEDWVAGHSAVVMQALTTCNQVGSNSKTLLWEDEMNTFEIWNTFLPSFLPWLFIIIGKMMMSCAYSFNYKKNWEPGSLKKEDKEPWIYIPILAWQVWNLIYFLSSFYFHHEDNDVLSVFIQIQNNGRPRKLKEGE